MAPPAMPRNATKYTTQCERVAILSFSVNQGFSMAPVSMVDRIDLRARDIVDMCAVDLDVGVRTGRMGRGGMNELRAGDRPEDDAVRWSISVVDWRSADCTETRLSYRRLRGLSANPLKLTTLAGLGVDGTEWLGVLNGSRETSSAMSDSTWSGMKKPVWCASLEFSCDVDGRGEDDDEPEEDDVALVSLSADMAGGRAGERS